jgi:hypothetical protein
MNTNGVFRFGLLVALILTLCLAPSGRETRAAGGWGGMDLYHVPMSWCVVIGSPAQASPNILGLNGTLDSNTDAVIWRRHERPTDNIYLNQAGISLRSAINDTWGTWSFPLIADPDTTLGVVGDVNGWDVNIDPSEFDALLDLCDDAYAAIGRAGIGITAVNINLYHDNQDPRADVNGDTIPDGDTQLDYIGVIGWGGCNEMPLGTCVIPYDGRVMVIDNKYLYPTVADRTFPPSIADPGGNLRFVITDSLDVLTGHEVGHALSLDHRNPSTALMFPSVTDNNSDNDADNTALNSAEVSILRFNAQRVLGVEMDPPGVFNPGKFVGMKLVDQGPNEGNFPPHVNISSAKVVFDQLGDEVHLSQTVKGLLPRDGRVQEFVVLVDFDNDTATGCPLADLPSPGNTAFLGTDVVAFVTISDATIVASEAFDCSSGVPVQMDVDNFEFEIHTLRLHPQYAAVNDQRSIPPDFVREVNNTINLRLINSLLPKPVALLSPFRVQMLSREDDQDVDKLDENDIGLFFDLELPSFAHCFPQVDGAPGGTVDVMFDGLRPNMNVHALLGPDLVLSGFMTDTNGEGTIALPIPPATTEGLHLVTIGHDGLALTADCTVNVSDCPAGAVTMSMPQTAVGQPGAAVQIPVDLTDVTGQGVFSAEVSVRFDAAVLNPTNVSLGAVTAGAGCQLTTNLTVPGSVIAAVACQSPMNGAGSLILIDFDVLACSGSVLDIVSAMLNEGIPDVCLDDGLFTSCADLSGKIVYYDANDPTGMAIGNTPVPAADVTITDGVFLMTETDCSGLYAFTDLAANDFVSMTPGKVNDFAPDGVNAVTAMDAALNAQERVGLINFSSPLQELAADVSANGDGTAFDSSLILQFDVGNIVQFPAATNLGSDWAFVPMPAVPAPNEGRPVPEPPASIAGAYTYNPLVESAADRDFIAVLFGDVTGSWLPSAACVNSSVANPSSLALGTESRRGPVVTGNSNVTLPKLKAAPGDLIRVPISMTVAAGIVALDFDIQFDPEVLRFHSAEVGTAASGFNIASNGRHPGHARVGMYDISELATPGEVVVLTFEVIGRPGSRTALSLPLALINEGRIGATVQEGEVFIRATRDGHPGRAPGSGR